MLGTAKSTPIDVDEPLSTRGWSVESLTGLSESMKPIPRISASALLSQGKKEELEAKIREYEDTGEPVIVEGWHELSSWPGGTLFGVDWLIEHGEDVIEVRDCVSAKDKIIPFVEFVERSRALSTYAEKGETERLYGKDAQCPEEWQKWLLESELPEHLKPGGSEDLLRFLKGREHVETLMCYHGIGDTFTPAHKDLCASNGHNLLLSSVGNGSAFWFMTASASAPNAASFFQEKLGTELDHEARIVLPEEFASAGFTVYVAEQKLGDLVLVPRRSCHQVVNHGGITTKLSWSKMSLCGLETAFYHELPLYRRVCRNETYRIKLLIYRALLAYSARLKEMLDSLAGTESTPCPSPVSQEGTPDDDYRNITFPEGASSIFKQTALEAEQLVDLYGKVVREEYQGQEECKLSKASPPSTLAGNNTSKEDGVDYDILTCDFCGADIFQSYFECRRCRRFEGDEVLLCPGCVAEGRHCPCARMDAAQKYSVDSLINVHTTAAELVNKALVRGHGPRIIPLSQGYLKFSRDTHPCLFETACYILRMRLKAEAQNRFELRCRVQTKAKTACVAPLGGALNCKKCHSSRCFKHHLEKSLHVTEACYLHTRTDDHAKLHEFHMANFKDPIDKWEQLYVTEEKGTACDMYPKLAFLARNYNNCLPQRGDLEHGWYDRQKRRKVILTLNSSPTVLRKTTLPSNASKKKRGSSCRNRSDDEDESSLSSVSEHRSQDDSGSDYIGKSRKKPRARSRKKSEAKEVPEDVLQKILGLEEKFREGVGRDERAGAEKLTEEQRAEYKSVSEWGDSQKRRGRPSRKTTARPNLKKRLSLEAERESTSLSGLSQVLSSRARHIDNDQKSDDDPIDILSSVDRDIDPPRATTSTRAVEAEAETARPSEPLREALETSTSARTARTPVQPVAPPISEELKAEITFLRSMRDDLTKLPELQLQYAAIEERMDEKLARIEREQQAMQGQAREREEQILGALDRVKGIEKAFQCLSEARDRLETELGWANSELRETKTELANVNLQMRGVRMELVDLRSAVARFDEDSSSDEDEESPSTALMRPPHSRHESVQYNSTFHHANSNGRYSEKQTSSASRDAEAYMRIRPSASAGALLGSVHHIASGVDDGGEHYKTDYKRSTASSTSSASMYVETSPTISAHERKRRRNEDLAYRSPNGGARPHWHQQQHQHASLDTSPVEGRMIYSNERQASSSTLAYSPNHNGSQSFRAPFHAQSQDSFGPGTSRNRPKKKRARKH